MRLITLVLMTCFVAISILGQSYSSVVHIVTVHSQNENFSLVSIPYDNESPSVRGVTRVFARGSSSPLYTLPRGFDSVNYQSNNLILSDDGNTIVYLLDWGANEEEEGLRSISIYNRGELKKSYTLSEITGCDLKKERCSLVYSNFDEVVDKEKGNIGTRQYKKVFKAGVSDEEKFLSDYPIFTNNDVVYLTDSKRTVHRFKLSDARLLDSQPFTEIYDEIKNSGRFNKVSLERIEAPLFRDFPNTLVGTNVKLALSKIFGMKQFVSSSGDDERYKRYSFTISGYLMTDGSFELTELDSMKGLPRDSIVSFFAQNRFDTTLIPRGVDRWFLSRKHFHFRKANDKVARQERQEELRVQRMERQNRLVAEMVDGRYIPKDLPDTFEQLDKELPEITRKEMKALKARSEMIVYHHGLGTWLRNNWGLWGGSRLQKYFTDKGIRHPDDMSSIILYFYWDWLQGDRDKWKEWERDPKQKIF